MYELFWKKDLMFGFFKNSDVYLSDNQINRGCIVDVSLRVGKATIY